MPLPIFPVHAAPAWIVAGHAHHHQQLLCDRCATLNQPEMHP